VSKKTFLMNDKISLKPVEKQNKEKKRTNNQWLTDDKK